MAEAAAALDGLRWNWIALMIVAPLPLGALLAWPLWRRRETILGNIAGCVVIFGAAFALILRESVELDTLRRRCFDAGNALCFPAPGAFARYAIYAGLALAEGIALFGISLSIEHRIRERDYAPEWRR